MEGPASKSQHVLGDRHLGVIRTESDQSIRDPHDPPVEGKQVQVGKAAVLDANCAALKPAQSQRCSLIPKCVKHSYRRAPSGNRRGKLPGVPEDLGTWAQAKRSEGDALAS